MSPGTPECGAGGGEWEGGGPGRIPQWAGPMGAFPRYVLLQVVPEAAFVTSDLVAERFGLDGDRRPRIRGGWPGGRLDRGPRAELRPGRSPYHRYHTENLGETDTDALPSRIKQR